MSYTVGCTILNNRNDAVGINSFLDSDYKEKALIVIEKASSEQIPELDVFGNPFKPEQTSLTTINDTSILYTYLENPGTNASIKNATINMCGQLIKGVETMIFFQPYHVHLENFIEKHNEYFSIPEVAVTYSDFEVSSKEKSGRQFLNPYVYAELSKNIFVYNNMAIKYDILKQIGFDTNLTTLEDYDLIISVCKQYILAHIPECLYLSDRHTFTDINQKTYDSDLRYIKSKFTQN